MWRAKGFIGIKG